MSLVQFQTGYALNRDDYSYHYWWSNPILSHLQWGHDEGLSVSTGKDDSRYGWRCVALTRWWVSSGTTTAPFYRYNHKCSCISCLVHCRWRIQCCKSIRQILLKISLMAVTSCHDCGCIIPPPRNIISACHQSTMLNWGLPIHILPSKSSF